MKIKLLILMLGIMLSVLLCDCGDKTNANEHIEIHSKDSTIIGDINIFLDDGYWVRDYSINYDNMQVVLNLKKDDSDKREKGKE